MSDPTPFDPQLWPLVEPILDEVLELQGAERVRRIQELCGGNEQVLAAVLRLVAADESGHDPLSAPLEDRAARILARSAPVMDVALPKGHCIGPWRLEEPIGRGGMGTVYRARRVDGAFDQEVALKLLARPDPDGTLSLRLDQERRILAPLQHPNIARLVDGGISEEGRPWFAMEHVDGDSITQWCEDQQADLDTRLSLFVATCSAVAYAHRHLIVHRDLKPSNILVSSDGVVKLVDFGIAKILGPTQGADLTRVGSRLMTPSYAAPEQVRGEPITTSADVYGLGAILYELICRHAPFLDRSITDRQLEQAVLHEPPTPLPTNVPRDLARIIEMALRKESGARYPSVDAMREDIERLRRNEPIRARRATVGYRLRCYARRHRAGVLMSGLVLGALAFGLVSTIWQARIAQREAKRARQVSEFLVTIFSEGSRGAAAGHIPTAHDLLDAGRSRLATQLDDDPRLRAELTLMLGDFYFNLGSYASAESVLSDALATTELAYGAHSGEWANAANALGCYYLERGDLERAEPLFEQALEISQRGGKNLLAENAASEANLASVSSRRGDHEAAISGLNRAIELDRRADPNDQIEYATNLNNLGVELLRADRTTEADSVLSLALDLRRRTMGLEHPDVATSLHNLANAKEDAGSATEALSLYDQALAMRRRLLPENHPDIAASLTSKGGLLRSQGRLDEAASCLEAAVQIQRAIGGEPTYELARTLNSLGTLAYSRGDYAAAAKWFEEAADGFDRTVGPESPAALTTRNNFAVILHREGELVEAREQMMRVLTVRERVEGSQSQSVGFSHKGIGMVCLDLGDIAAAESHLELAQRLLEPYCEEEIQACAEVRMGLGHCALAAGDSDRADSLLHSSHADLERLLSAGHPLLVENERLLAELDRR